MAKVISSVRITPVAYDLLNDLAGKLGKPKAQVIEEALRILEEDVFWREVQEAFACGESPEMRSEREVWDSTASDGLRGDHW
jgi:predicted DNA-binding protein